MKYSYITSQLRSQNWQRPFWIILLIASSFIFTFMFACAVPFAAFATATALTLHRRDAFMIISCIWLSNQLTGFLFMAYPLDANTFAWGAALGVTALFSTFAARYVAMHFNNMNAFLRYSSAFTAAFMAYEMVCYISALLLGGTENFTAEIQVRIFLINACALAALIVVNKIGSALNLRPTYKISSLRHYARI